MRTTDERTVQLHRWGRIRYAEAWQAQTRLFEATVTRKLENRKREQGGLPPLPTEDHLVFCEHPHVYTLGKSGKESHLLVPEGRLHEIGAEYFRTNRGGDVTYHGPGQLVAYPIFDLDCYFTDIHRYLRTLEEAVIGTLAQWGVESGRIDGLTGVWVGMGAENPRKVCAMGVKASRWVTMHGLALNVNPDLSYFGHIVPCGIADKAVTSMAQEVGGEIPLAEVERALALRLESLFGMRLLDPVNANEPAP